MSPSILRVGGHRFHFFSNENDEPAHVHVSAAGKTAKFWLNPPELARNYGYAAHELRELQRIVVEHREEFESAWHVHFSR